MVGFLEAKDIIIDFGEENFGTRGDVIKLQKDEEGWEGELELTRIDEYRKKHAKPQMVERYGVELDEDGKVVSFERLETRSLY